VIMDHGKILIQGTPAGLIGEHIGTSIIDVRGAGPDLKQYLLDNSIDFDHMGERLIVYNNGNSAIEEAIRTTFCRQQCTFRSASLEDVFLRLTGRELRE